MDLQKILSDLDKKIELIGQDVRLLRRDRDLLVKWFFRGAAGGTITLGGVITVVVTVL